MAKGKTISAKIWHPFMNSKENISNPWIKNFLRVSTKNLQKILRKKIINNQEKLFEWEYSVKTVFKNLPLPLSPAKNQYHFSKPKMTI